ncbi:MAG: hypothetical protein BWZ06_00534 [Bacteroidetes bacterium ADurb.BinA261]|mgnify:CR=1 FL=1|jgi:hypothetical protein|nr:MAG: hypothetical protein BWZ06_00534 [Bacteroidetes bacterium ADurb.BinA261]
MTILTMNIIPNKHEQIADYLLFMWQTEDVLRACKLDLDIVRQTLVDPLPVSDEEKSKMLDWYEGLIMMMKSEGVQEKGHLQINKNMIIELTDLHLRLQKDPKEAEYMATYYHTLPYIVELRAKSKVKDIPEIETCFTAMYGYLLLKIQKKEISKETQAAVNQIGKLLRLLTERYKTMYQEEE